MQPPHASDTANRRDPLVARRFAQQGLKQKPDINKHLAAPQAVEHASLNTASVKNIARCLRKQPASVSLDVSQHSSIPQQSLHSRSGKMGSKHEVSTPANHCSGSEHLHLAEFSCPGWIGSSRQRHWTMPL
ncbi:unnamed protein product [Symbiodinium natans]|uniref:Uncharacterized protein n=1 Tax=Symbiodinium natans TaxID=878477 RepID=A0A812N334_9DINO|nr:unnamed protein product [Symbiodinium natans]